MNSPRNRLLLEIAFVGVLLAFVTFSEIFITVYQIGYPYSTILHCFNEEVEWGSGMMLMVFVFLHTRYYVNLAGDRPDRVSTIIAIILFGCISLLGCYAGDLYGFALYKFCFPILLVAGLVGGLRVSLPAVAFCIVIAHCTTLVSYDTDGWLFLMMILSAFAGGICKTGWIPRWFIYAVPPVLALIFFIPLDAYVAEWNHDLAGDYVLFKMSGVSLLFNCYYALILLNLFLALMRDRENASRSEKDLSAAHAIQMAAVPTEFPVSRSLCIYGMMVPATEVGGDFYDSFIISRNLTAFVIADVSDKGLPASMLMMRMLGSFKTATMMNSDPGKVLTAVNRELCRNNPANQFLTAWMGVYDSDTGILQYANAGHTPPYICGSTGRYERLEVKKGTVIGFSDAVRYKTSQIVLGDGDSIFTYTDGVNEAFNAEGEQFGRERLLGALNTDPAAVPEKLIGNVYASVKDFAGDIPASDDITMLSIMVHRPAHRTITVPGRVEELDAVTEFLEEALSAKGCPVKHILKMQIVAEEIFVNICDHAYENTEGEVTVYCRYLDGEIKITFCDDAEFFNPINKEDIDIDADVGNWPIGGFGIHMVKKLVTHMDYKYFAGKNIFTIWKKVESGEKPAVSEE